MRLWPASVKTNVLITDRVSITNRDLIEPGPVTDRVPITDLNGPITDHVPTTDIFGQIFQ